MRFSFLPIVILMMPILEIAGFIIVGKAIGLWLTLALILSRHSWGTHTAPRRRRHGAKSSGCGRTGAQPADELVNGAMRVVAGILLIIPGFITDILGLLLLSRPFAGFSGKPSARASFLAHSGSPAPSKVTIPDFAMAPGLRAIRRWWSGRRGVFTRGLEGLSLVEQA
ncbi:membrane protein FxsA [Agrobacterium fabrum]|uniref:FxsA family protein n=1 Tax=Agrobacterium fabrum TaxID=1176649 RepID=UPI00193E82A1|nr:FxsA family protein [Agrobacterium fabrum]QRM57983.1 membrane protein FxsA [Agrobacterium fabrum]